MQYDAIDADLFFAHTWGSWGSNSLYYATKIPLGKNRYRTFYFHRAVSERMLGGPIPKNMVIDHINGDKHDNRRSNIRITSPSINRFNEKINRSKQGLPRGVMQVGRKWRARCGGNIGVFLTREEAAEAVRLRLSQILEGK